ncbi:50S ribosomal protein L29 [Candidatus Pacearchaeota archaeon]|nr:50S ribosomal protein L29 [Candidatus Pacearchaeota archaeon]
MATLKAKDIRNMSKGDREKKLKELKMELIKSRSGNSKTGSKTKEIKRIIARILTLNKPTEENSSKEIEKNK